VPVRVTREQERLDREDDLGVGGLLLGPCTRVVQHVQDVASSPT
jgi:hypothetical protein